jgi:hypothetical protein
MHPSQLYPKSRAEPSLVRERHHLSQLQASAHAASLHIHNDSHRTYRRCNWNGNERGHGLEHFCQSVVPFVGTEYLLGVVCFYSVFNVAYYGAVNYATVVLYSVST